MCKKLIFLVSVVFALVAFPSPADASDPYQASNPDPPDGAICVDPDVVLSWTAGVGVWSRGRHIVYFGTDYDAVDNADTGSPEYQGMTAAHDLD